MSPNAVRVLFFTTYIESHPDRLQLAQTLSQSVGCEFFLIYLFNNNVLFVFFLRAVIRSDLGAHDYMGRGSQSSSYV